MPYKRNKYNAKKKSYKGRSYDSTAECNHAIKLDAGKQAGEIKEITPQFKIALKVNGVHICNYFMDFRVMLVDGTIEYHEVKGYATQLWRMKWRLLEATIQEHENAKLVLIKV